MRTIHRLFTFVVLMAANFTFAQVESLINNIHLNESIEVVTKKLSEVSNIIDLVTIDQPIFPLAQNKEEHLICAGLKTDSGILDRVAFTFADDKLVYIEVRGNAYEVFHNTHSGELRNYLDFEVDFDQGLFLNKSKDAVWIMTKEAIHPNLFTWENPYLKTDSERKTLKIKSSIIPSFIKMGSSLDDMKPLLERHSSFIDMMELDGSDPNAQLQLDCFGISYLGFPRKLEARFGDNKLNVVWILTGKGEENRIRKALVAEFGEPVFKNEAWEIFNNWQVGLRKDKPEVLLMEKEIGLGYKKTYFKQ